MSRQNQALTLIVLSAGAMGVMAFFVKIAVASGLSGTQVAFTRFAIGLVPLLFVMKRLGRITSARLDLLLVRCVAASAAVILYFIAIQHGTVGGATLLNSTAPVFAGLFSMIFLRERVSRRVLVPMAIALTGAVLTARSFPSGLGWPELLALLSAIASGAAVVAMRASRRSEDVWAVYGSVTFFGMMSTAPFAYAHWRVPTTVQLITLLTVAVLACVAQIAMTVSLRWLHAMTVGIVAQLAVIVSMTLGYLFLGEPLSWRIIAAAFLTLAGVTGVVRALSADEPSGGDVERFEKSDREGGDVVAKAA